MIPTPPTETADNVPGQDLRRCLQLLETGLREPVPASVIERTLDSLRAGLDRALVENAGMADELICLYEQIGVIFDVTKKLAEVNGEEQILEHFLKSLRRSFAPRSVDLARVDAARNAWHVNGFSVAPCQWLETMLTKTAHRGGITVEKSPPGAFTEFLHEIMLAPIYSGEDLIGVLVLGRNADAAPFRSGEMLLLESLTTFCGDLIRNHRLVQELRVMSVAMVRSLVNAVDQKDEYTSGHSLRVAYFAQLLGRRLQLSQADLQMLEWSALLHDVGKIGIRDSVLKKEGKLTDEEFNHIKEHPVRSHRVVKNIPQLDGALDGILYHHERYDGRGYPSGLSGEAIPMQARIIQIADVFDALTSSRSYRQAYTWEAALEIMDKEAGTVLDPRLEQVFAAMMRDRLRARPSAWEELSRRAAEFTDDVGDRRAWTGPAAEQYSAAPNQKESMQR